jgi:excisionase family DNA binding protein
MMRTHEAISIVDIAQRTGLGRPTIYRWLESGTMPGRKQDERGRFYVCRPTFERWLRDQTRHA